MAILHASITGICPEIFLCEICSRCASFQLDGRNWICAKHYVGGGKFMDSTLRMRASTLAMSATCARHLALAYFNRNSSLKEKYRQIWHVKGPNVFFCVLFYEKDTYVYLIFLATVIALVSAVPGVIIVASVKFCSSPFLILSFFFLLSPFAE